MAKLFSRKRDICVFFRRLLDRIFCGKQDTKTYRPIKQTATLFITRIVASEKINYLGWICHVINR